MPSFFPFFPFFFFMLTYYFSNCNIDLKPPIRYVSSLDVILPIFISSLTFSFLVFFFPVYPFSFFFLYANILFFKLQYWFECTNSMCVKLGSNPKISSEALGPLKLIFLILFAGYVFMLFNLQINILKFHSKNFLFHFLFFYFLFF